MKRWWPHLRLWRSLVGLFIGALGAVTTARASVDAYDFDYRISGHTAARPVQVFGDAERTYFQFVAGRPVPLILAEPAGERMVPVQEGPYHVVAGRSAEYTLQLAGRRARVEHAGRMGPARPPPPDPDAVAPVPLRRGVDDRTLSSYATPVRGDVIEWVETERPVKHGTGSAPLVPRPPAVVASRRDTSSVGRPLRGNFDILLSDGTVSTSLRRWARDAGYRLEWESSIDAPVLGDLTLDTRRFPEAVERIVTGLRASGYPLRLDTEEGRVLRIRHDAPP